MFVIDARELFGILYQALQIVGLVCWLILRTEQTLKLRWGQILDVQTVKEILGSLQRHWTLGFLQLPRAFSGFLGFRSSPVPGAEGGGRPAAAERSRPFRVWPSFRCSVSSFVSCWYRIWRCRGHTKIQARQFRWIRRTWGRAKIRFQDAYFKYLNNIYNNFLRIYRNFYQGITNRPLSTSQPWSGLGRVRVRVKIVRFSSKLFPLKISAENCISLETEANGWVVTAKFSSRSVRHMWPSVTQVCRTHV